MKGLGKSTLFVSAILCFTSAVDAQEQNTPEPRPEPTPQPTLEPEAESDEVLIIGQKAKTQPGSAHTVHETVLKEWKERDVGRVLDQVPGVNIQEEEGFGLRPNIGMRGATPHRSRKITLMEDGVLVAPAPYSAPAAYYFPSMQRMRKLEVLKGPLAIKAGPNTIGGGLNLVTKEVPDENEGIADLSYGSFGYQRLGLSYGGRQGSDFGYLLSGEFLGSEGFYELPDDSNTGFRKGDGFAKFQWRTHGGGKMRNTLSLKLGYGSEISNASYLGLTPSDFDSNPYQRYAASHKDKVQWLHRSIQVSNLFRDGKAVKVRFDVYQNAFERSWYRFNGFQDSSVDVRSMLNNPTQAQQSYLRILRGEADSTSPLGLDKITLVDNDRKYLSQGAQIEATFKIDGEHIAHQIETGVRYHIDSVDRNHTSDSFAMTSGQLIRDTTPTQSLTDNFDESKAIAMYVQDSISVAEWIFTPGLRAEIINTSRKDDINSGNDQSESNTYIMPGLGGYYGFTKSFGILAGAYRGITPVSPGQPDGTKPEESDNYEFGYRYLASGVRHELIGFYNDYRNIKGTCTFSSGCSTAQLDQEFDGGEAKIFGAEMLTSAAPYVGDARIPLQLNYTYTDAKFSNETTSDNPEWGVGQIKSGDPLPYIAAHNISASAGVEFPSWSFNTTIKHLSKRYDQSVEQDRREIEGYTILDLVGHWRALSWLDTYAKVENATDKAYLTSLRPFGDRPGMPRTISAGVEAQF